MAEEKELSKIGEVKQREIVQEMKDSYMDYAMSVIVSRALPDVRDGLKPVHRRILFSMHELGLTHLAKYRKSALVVGDTLGKFHPHGDQAVYGSLARMAQDFSLRYPLINGQGNFGSIDNDPPAAMRYCITGDSLVVTNRCLEEIASVSKKEDISLKVLSFGKKINSASKLFDSGVHPILRAETFRGYNLKGSFNHPILTLGQNPETGAPMFEWKLLETLKNTDYAVIDRNDQLLWPKKEPSLKKFHPKIKNRSFNVHKLPTQMSPDLAFLIGAIIAEGHISIDKEKNYAKIGFCNTNEEYLNAFKKAFKNLFPDCHKYEAVRKPLSYGKKEFTSIEICSTQIAEFLMNLGVKAVPSSEKQVPSVVLDSTKESLAAFLRGFVEGDGSIYSSSVKRSFEIAFISTSKKLLEQIQIVLLRFGADSFLRYEPTRSMWRLFLRGRNNLNIFKEIGFVSKKKKERLEEYCQRNSDYHTMSKTDFVPFLSEYLKSKYKDKKIKWIFKEWLIKHNIDRYSKLKIYRSYLEQFIEKEDLALIDLFVNNNYLFDKIASVENAGKERVYSFRVDSGCHSFVSNGFISHNTEARMSKLGEELLRNIAKDTVEFRPNYDGTRKEPVVLPCPVPQLLLNGTLGIAVGMATSIPPHNLGEVCDALTHMIDNPKANTEDVFEFIKGPDFPTAGMIYGRKDIIETYTNGRGPIVIRGKAEIKENEKLSQILITEIPYQTPKSTLIEQFAKLVQDKKIDGIRDIRDESDKDGMRIAIDLQKGAYPSKILNRLYKFSDLQRTFHLNMIALVDGIQPKSLSLPEILNYFIEHRKEVVVRRSKFDLKKAEERAHILEGLHKCLSKIDTVIKIIKASKSREDAVKNLIKEIKITEIQANAILETKLAALAKLEREKIENELKELKLKIKELMELLNSPQKIKTEIKKEIQEMKEKFGDDRRTKVLVQRVGEIAEEDLIPQEETMITVTQGGYIKRINPATYKIQKRGGKGIMGMKTLQEDIVEHFLTAQTHDSLFFFTDSGKVFQTVAYEIPEGSRVARGRGLLNFLELSSDEKALSLLSFGKNEEEAGIKDLVMVTKDGVIKRTKLEEFKNVRKSGLIAINLKKGDLLKKAVKTTGENDIMLVTKKGQSIRFKEQDIREMGRPAAGVRGITLKKDDEVVGMDVVDKNIEEKQYLLIVMANGYGKKTDVKEYRKQGRGGSGIKTANVTPKTGEIIYSKVITDDVEDLIVISQQGQVIRTKISSIAKISRSTQGVRIMKLADGDKVASAASI